MSYIYQITNIITSQVYVGKTARTITERFNEHIGWHNSRDTYLYRAMRKYGPENFTVEQLEEVPDELANDRECYWIEVLGTLAPIGYNLTKGGNGGDTSASPKYRLGITNRPSTSGINNPNYGKRGVDSPNYNREWSDEQKRNMQQGCIESWQDNHERKQLASNRISGKNNPGYGKTPKNAVKVELDGVLYDSIAACQRMTKRSPIYIKNHGTLIHETPECKTLD